MPAHGIHFQQQNSALRIQHARIQSLITPVNTQTGSKSSIKAGVLHAPSPCWVSTPRTTQLPITNQDLHTRNAMPAFSRIMHLLMHVENPRMGRDITQSSSSLRKSNACTAIRRKISIAFISCSINHSIQQQHTTTTAPFRLPALSLPCPAVSPGQARFVPLLPTRKPRAPWRLRRGRPPASCRRHAPTRKR